MSVIIELNNVSFSAQQGIVVNDISMMFKRNKTTAIVGPSGGGKSTVLKLAAGLLVPNNGNVYYEGKSISHMNRGENGDFRRNCSFVFQDSALWANMDLFSILELPLKIHFPSMTAKERKSRINAVTEKVGYKKKLTVRPAYLSMGEQKLIAFARALLCEPKLMFLDEWTESLDENAADRLINIVRSKQREGCTFLFISHDMRLIIDLADYVAVIIDGKVSAMAPKEEIISDLLLNDFIKIGIAS
ncbi:MAG: ATP-binding cassette domain-containing protein [Treponema sp.]|jgi:ABC-type multidrug transport system ATPase subunit|nr:ATP-binding cassette domain-containing protein [Treponema sp.]